MESAENILVEQVACDWLSLATWEPSELQTVQDWLEKDETGGDPSPGKWLQYKGARGPSWFTGHAAQEELDHFVAWISGALADDALRHFAHRKHFTDAFSKCTRMDVQLTLPDWKRKWSLARAADRLEKGQFGRWPRIPGEGPSVTYWHSKTGDTVYIGSRKSPLMTRIYQKEVKDARFIRLEIEYKAGRAQSLYNACEGSVTIVMEQALTAEIRNWPDGLQNYMRPFTDWAYGRAALRPNLLRAPTSDERRLEWLRRIAPTLGDLALSESVGQEARVELLRILFPTA